MNSSQKKAKLVTNSRNDYIHTYVTYNNTIV